MGALADALVSRGGYNPLDAANAETGPRAGELATEFLGTSSGGGGRATGGLDMGQVSSVSDFVQGQFAAEDVPLNALVEKMGDREDPLALYSKYEEEAGVPVLKKAATSLAGEINTLEDTLQAIEPNVSARTSQSLVTESQRQGIVEAERKPLREKLSNFTRDLGRLKEMLSNAMAGVATKTELGLRGQEMELEPLKLQYTTMVDRSARTLTGFTEDRQTQLDMLWDKLQRDRDLSDQDWALANQLGAEERSYKKALQEAAAQAGYSVTGQESIDQLLGIVGDKAAEQIAFDRAQANKSTASEKEQIAARSRLQADVEAGARNDHLLALYGGTLDADEIVAAYNAGPMAEQFGRADVGSDVRNVWKLTQDADAGVTPKKIINPDGSITTF